MTALAIQCGVNRVVQGVAIPYACGDPHLPPQEDRLLRREILMTAFRSLETEVKEPTLFKPKVESAAQTH